MFRITTATLAFFLIMATAHAQGDPVAGAKRAVGVLRETRSLKAMASNYTNETAASIGLVMSAASNMMLNKGFQNPQKPESCKRNAKCLEAAAQFKQLDEELSRILRKYGAGGYNSNPFAIMMATGKNRSVNMPPRLKAQGRTMLTEVAETFVQIVPGAQDDMFKGMGRKTRMPAPNALQYKVLSPSRVAITDPKQPSNLSTEARFEDGQWRLHYLWQQSMARQ